MHRSIVLACAAALLGGCSQPYRSTTGGATSPVVPAILSQPVDPGAIDAAARGGVALPRMLVRHADLGVEVEKLDPAEQRVTSMTKSLGGWVENQASTVGGFSEGRRLTVRVPSAQLEAAIDSIERIGRITSRVVGAEDVTDAVVDLDARVTSLRATRDRLRQLLDRTGSVADVVAVEKELSRVQMELDALEARLKEQRGQVEMARLSVRLTPKRVLGPLGLALAGVGWVVQKLFFIR